MIEIGLWSQQEKLATKAAGNASLSSAKGKLAAGEFLGAKAAIRSATQVCALF
jgi:hypothetical protein